MKELIHSSRNPMVGPNLLEGLLKTLTHLRQCFISIPSGNVREPLVL